ncbi:RabGAP TBC [Rhizopogon vinicolor AM-OR11-026]|uniref:RabGAP TBC n=1 Tax=Rhizopogon vinicolor AM-OR11-026 TaxID=1314800 RepID=A0A1B7MXU7_9AGAM|nr:RabGAP TBC [Rhizopogon vinicolor AM-OR11-026]
MFPDAISSETPPTESPTSIDAHRQREGKWMALLPVVPPSQARKNKKVKRLLLEGVPSSVRYLVWCHLTDSKARAITGVYAQLGRRPRVAAFSDFEKDAKTYFPEQPQLHPHDGPLVSLLQAYLSMVPDIQYSSGLTSIAGHLLLLSPEEDAFWIFASMMDAYLRPYFSANTIQLEVDSALLSKAIEANDPGVFKKLYVTLCITPGTIAKPWFSTLFVGTLPVDYLHRIWDMFLYEGVPLLIRVGLTLVQCVRHLILQATSEEVAMEYLLHPPLACLPSTADTFLNQALSMKLKDDDVRKQRIKMESRLKRQTQSRSLSTNASGMQTASISLPKAS